MTTKRRMTRVVERNPPAVTGNMWNLDTGAGVSHLDRLTLARIDVDPPETRTFEAIDR